VSGDGPVLVESEGAVVTLRLNAVANRNALAAPLVDGLLEALRRAGANPATKAVLLTHAPPAFSSGADLVEARDGGMEAGIGRVLELLRTIVGLPVPVLARLDGAVRAGGLGIVAACDIAVAGPAATFAFTETRLAIAPAVIALTVLPRMNARGAGRYLLSGETFGPREAAEIGLISAYAENPDDHLGPILKALSQAHRQGLEETKALLTAGLRERIEADGPAMVDLSGRLFASPEAKRLISSLLAR
jgi:enoyl-CoA hydratase